jgi:hypothetical protein
MNNQEESPRAILFAKSESLSIQRTILIRNKVFFKYFLLIYIVACFQTYHLSSLLFLSCLLLAFDTIYNWCYTWNMIWNIEGELLNLNEKESSHAS